MINLPNMKEKTKNGELTLGTYITLGDATVAELFAIGGFDFIRIDLEHGMIDISKVTDFVRAAQCWNVPTFVRVASISDITRVLDCGVQGIIVPDVKTREDALAAAEMVKFYPQGLRGSASGVRCVGYGTENHTDYIKKANEKISLLIQLESKEAIDNAEDILSVEGIDYVIVGKSDLAESMGMPGQMFHPDIVAIENKIIKMAFSHGKYPGCLVGSPARLKELYNLGVRHFIIAYDTKLFVTACQNQIKNFKAVLE